LQILTCTKIDLYLILRKKSVREKDNEGELTRMVFGVTETKEKRELSYFPRE